MTTPKGTFRGVNFMTPEVLGHYKLRKGWAELSQGRGMEGEPIYGVTVRMLGGARLTPDPSKLLYSRAEALRYIQTLKDA